MPSRIVSISSKYQLKGRIRRIEGGPVVSEVEVETAAGTVVSVVTTRSIADLDLRPGSEVLATLVSTEALLEKVGTPRLIEVKAGGDPSGKAATDRTSEMAT